MGTSAGPRRIVYATFATSRRSGGVWVMSEHVRLLRSAGYDACLWVPGPDGLPAWLGEAGPALIGTTVNLTSDDVLVLPEVPVIGGLDPAPGARKVILNQNHFYTFAAGDTEGCRFPGWSPEPTLWTVSAESRDVLTALFPVSAITVIPNPVDPELFIPTVGGPPSVAWFSRKRPNESRLLRRLLAIDPAMAGVALHAISDEPWPVVVDTLCAATVFIALGHTEGFGLPLVEALAAGCLVTGYGGGGGQELFAAPGTWPVPEQRPLLLARQVADLVSRGAELRGLAEENRAWVREHYGPERTQSALAAALHAAMSGPATAATAVHPAQWLDRVPSGFHLMG